MTNETEKLNNLCQQLADRADAELGAMIRRALAPVKELVSSVEVEMLVRTWPENEERSAKAEVRRVYLDEVLGQAGNAIFEVLKEMNRRDAYAAFLARVDDLSQELNDLRERVGRQEE